MTVVVSWKYWNTERCMTEGYSMSISLRVILKSSMFQKISKYSSHVLKTCSSSLKAILFDEQTRTEAIFEGRPRPTHFCKVLLKTVLVFSGNMLVKAKCWQRVMNDRQTMPLKTTSNFMPMWFCLHLQCRCKRM